jgi:hypothetical protein
MKRMSKNHEAGAPTVVATITITNCPIAMPMPKTSMLSDDNNAMASRQPPRRAAARNGGDSQYHPTIITETAINA